MSIENNLERIADALETLVVLTSQANDMVNAAVTPEPAKPKTTRKRKAKKAEAEPAPQSEPVPANDPAPAEEKPEAAEPVGQAEEADVMTPEELNGKLMALAQKGSPDTVNHIIGILKQCGASSVPQVPANRRQWVLDEATKLVQGAMH